MAHEVGHILGMWHPRAPWRYKSCSINGLMGRWFQAEKFEDCAKLDFKSMYHHYIINIGLDWCLTADFEGFNGKGKSLLLLCVNIKKMLIFSLSFLWGK